MPAQYLQKFKNMSTQTTVVGEEKMPAEINIDYDKALQQIKQEISFHEYVKDKRETFRQRFKLSTISATNRQDRRHFDLQCDDNNACYLLLR